MNRIRGVVSGLLLILLLGLTAPAQIGSDEILPNGKRSDGCTLIPDGHIRPCCLIHDREYYQGGTRFQRSESDKRLYNCVRKRNGVQHRIVAPLIWVGVRIGGSPYFPTSFRWGFGTNEKGYTEPRAADPNSSNEN
jgi:hypothetical protein